MITKLPCGCTINDEFKSTVHEPDGRHYPIGASPATFCMRCDLYRPCACVEKSGYKQYVSESPHDL